MQLTIGIYVQCTKIGGTTQHICRPWLNTGFETRDTMLQVALQRQAKLAREHLHQLIETGKANDLADWQYAPNHRTHVVKLRLTLRDRNVFWRLLLVLLPQKEGWIAFSPDLPEVWFDVPTLSSLESRAEETYTEWCKEYLRSTRAESVPDLSIIGEGWIEPLDLDLTSLERKKRRRGAGFASLFGGDKMQGDVELRSVGYALDDLASQYGQAIGRETFVSQLVQLLARQDHQSVLLVGPPGVGKTAVIQECVARRVHSRPEKKRGRELTWSVSPQRLISGMSYLGQWEERWLAILHEVSRRNHILYIQDLLGLLTAGLTRDSRLCTADVLKSFMAQHPIRMLAEISSEALAILRRRDRGLADLFHLIYIPEMDAAQTLAVLHQVSAQLEAVHGISFQPMVLKEIIDKQQTLAPHLAFPGKAIDVLHNLTRSEFQSIGRERLNQYLRRTTGVSDRMLDPNPDRREPIKKLLGRQLIGQPAAIAAAERVIRSACLRLAPPDRPLGVLLFLGPTGVGKTECAKAINATLFADETHLLRFDMNEITTPYAAEQLIGTFDEPDGRLTSAIRRFPFSVVLFDEIEKAHPDVFDYLLQVIGEGRLTDAHGRTVDFRNAVIIMTSNLGVNDDQSGIGFETSAARELTYHRAAQRFFRPEFFNRIDEVVVFQRLTREDIGKIAEIQIAQMLQRDGLWQRDVYARVRPEVLQWVIDQGFQPQLGARAIKRSLESHLVQPIGDLLAASQEDASLWIDVQRSTTTPPPAQSSPILFESHPLRESPARPRLATNTVAELIKSADRLVDAFQTELQTRWPNRNAPGVAGEEAANRVQYYAIHEQVFRCKERLKRLKESIALQGSGSIKPAQTGQAPTKSPPNQRWAGVRRSHMKFQAELDLNEEIEEYSTSLSTQDIESLARELDQTLRWTGSLLKSAWEPNECFVEFRFASSDAGFANLTGLEFSRKATMTPTSPAVQVWWDPIAAPAHAWVSAITNVLEQHFQYEVTKNPENGLRFKVAGVGCSGILAPVLGTYRLLGNAGWRSIGALIASPQEVLTAPWDAQPVILPWEEIQGNISSDFHDLRTGRKLEFMDSLTEWHAWWMELLPTCDALLAELPHLS